ncbi:MAG: hypothetical protein AAF484_06545 [Pseudomonadota bacterium]
MPIRFDIPQNPGQPSLEPPGPEEWPRWVLRVRRRKWNWLPVAEVLILILCLVVTAALARSESCPASGPRSAQYTPPPLVAQS